MLFTVYVYRVTIRTKDQALNVKVKNGNCQCLFLYDAERIVELVNELRPVRKRHKLRVNIPKGTVQLLKRRMTMDNVMILIARRQNIVEYLNI